MIDDGRAAQRALPGRSWRLVVLVLVALTAVAFVAGRAPIEQDPSYHRLVDQRAVFGIPNFMDVASNAGFLLVGLAGLRFCFGRSGRFLTHGWRVLFAGVTLVSAGSAWYHLQPSDASLVWDRLPMTIAFMGLFSALLAEQVNERLGGMLLAPAVLAGLTSVIVWRWSGDLRFYAAVQAIPLLSIPVLLLVFRARYSHRWLWLAGLAAYVLAKGAEAHDREIFALTGNALSGHTLKHLLAALGIFALLAMLRRRRSLGE